MKMLVLKGFSNQKCHLPSFQNCMIFKEDMKMSLCYFFSLQTIKVNGSNAVWFPAFFIISSFMFIQFWNNVDDRI